MVSRHLPLSSLALLPKFLRFTFRRFFKQLKRTRPNDVFLEPAQIGDHRFNCSQNSSFVSPFRGTWIVLLSSSNPSTGKLHSGAKNVQEQRQRSEHCGLDGGPTHAKAAIMASQAVLIAETIAGMKKAIKRTLYGLHPSPPTSPCPSVSFC